MRIISGKHRGRKLFSPPGTAVRPTSDMAKEALFNILQTVIFGADFLDLFAGSGGVGLEALSRGARVTLVDSSPDSIALIKKNVALLKEEPAIILADAARFIRNAAPDSFDIIFLDPPYEISADERDGLPDKIYKSGALRQGGAVIMEIKRGLPPPEPSGFEITDIREYGNSSFIFLRYKSQEEDSSL